MSRPQLQLECLEDRCVPAAMLIGRDLVVTGTAKADIVSIDETQVLVGFRQVSSGFLQRWEAVYEDGVRVTMSQNVPGIQFPSRQDFRASAFDAIRVNAGDGDDYVINNTNFRSTMFGGNGDDTLIGGNGVDYLYGEGDDDWLFAREGYFNYLRGGAGNDYLTGGNSIDYLIGDSGKDRLWGNGGNDYLNGGADNDTLNGGGGSDMVMGGTGYDTGIWDNMDSYRHSVERWLIPFMAGSAPDVDLDAPDIPGAPCPIC